MSIADYCDREIIDLEGTIIDIFPKERNQPAFDEKQIVKIIIHDGTATAELDVCMRTISTLKVSEKVKISDVYVLKATENLKLLKLGKNSRIWQVSKLKFTANGNQIEGKKQFCIESRISRWKISFKGKLMLFVFEGKTLQRLLKESSGHMIFQRVRILIESNKSELVNMLLRRLRSSFVVGYNLEKTARDWYDETTDAISKMKIDSEKYPKLEKLKQEIIDSMEREKILKSKYKF